MPDGTISTVIEAVRDEQLVTTAGEPVAPLIDGVTVRRARTQMDARGEVCEIYDPSWGIHPAPMVYAYLITVRPGAVKGWVAHDVQTDRLFAALGVVRIVLFDDRPGSATRGMVNELHLGERDRGTVVIPPGVFHALHNVGTGDATLVNHPTHAYDHARPDKRRLPLDDPRIPFQFTGVSQA